jgi:hypothetical protein
MPVCIVEKCIRFYNIGRYISKSRAFVWRGKKREKQGKSGKNNQKRG